KESDVELMMIYPLLNLRSAALTLDLEPKTKLALHLFGANERSTELAAEAAKTGLAWADLNLEKIFAGDEAGKPSKSGQMLIKKMRQAVSQAQVKRDGVTAQLTLALDVDAATLQAALTEAVVKVRQAANRTQSMN